MKTLTTKLDFSPADGSITSPSTPGRLHTQLRSAGLILPTATEEAAWQLLRHFISPIDCNAFIQSIDHNGNLQSRIVAMNVSTTLNALFNGEAVRLNYFCKKQFVAHVRGEAKFYYRSRWNGFASTGYGSYDNASKSLSFDATRFALDGKKVTSDRIALVLLGFDIDAHNGEVDVGKTTDLILSFFPNSYHEPSTNGRGRHVYVKLFYDILTAGTHAATLYHLQWLTDSLSHTIDKLRLARGYDAGLDRIRGLPTRIGLERDENGRVIVVNDRPKLKIVIRNPVIKVPFYRNCSMATVDQFFNAPFYSMEKLSDIRASMFDAGIFEDFHWEDDIQQGIDEILINRLPHEFDSDLSERQDSQDNPNDNNNHNSVFPAAFDYRIASKNLVAIIDSGERRLEFGMLLARHLRRPPTGAELQTEYRRAGLSKAESKSDQIPARFDEISRWLQATFDVEKCRFGYRGYYNEQTRTEALMAQRVSGLKLTWSKGNGRKAIDISKLAALWWAMKHSQGKMPTTHFSRKQCKAALQETLGVKSHNAEIAAMQSVLENIGLIQKAGGYCPGYFGRGWAVNEL